MALTTATPRALGQVLYTDYVYAFEIAAVILLVAIIAAIVPDHASPSGNQASGPEQAGYGTSSGSGAHGENGI